MVTGALYFQPVLSFDFASRSLERVTGSKFLNPNHLQQAWCGISDMLDTGVSVQILLEDPDYGFRPELGDAIIPLVAGMDSDKSTGLTYYFTQQELKQLLELERLTQLQIEKLHEGQFNS